jgi:hypothetical protein
MVLERLAAPDGQGALLDATPEIRQARTGQSLAGKENRR